MSRSTSALLLSPGSDQSDLDDEARTTQILSMARLSDTHKVPYSKFVGLESPDYPRYTSRVDMKSGEVKRFSLTSTSSSEGWNTPGLDTPDLKATLSRYQDRPFSLSLVSDSPSDTMSPVDGAQSQPRWVSPMSQVVPSTPAFTTSQISSWSTMTVSTPSVSSSTENTQTWTWAATTPFKASASIPASQQKENSSPNTITFATTPKSLVPSEIADLPSNPSWGTPLGDHTLKHTGSVKSPSEIRVPSTGMTPTSTTSIPRGNPMNSPITNIGCLVDINGSFTQEISVHEDECTRTIRLEVQREMASLTEGLTGPILNADTTLESTGSDLNTLESATIEIYPSLKQDAQAQHLGARAQRRESNYGTSSINELIAGESLGLLIELKSSVEVSEAVARVLRGEAVLVESWLNDVRALLSLDDIIMVLQALYVLNESHISMIQESLDVMLEQGEVEVLEFATAEKVEDSDLLRVYRATDALFSSRIETQ